MHNKCIICLCLSLSFTRTSHKEQLNSLEEADPEFYKFLLKHDDKLLKFSDSEEDECNEDNESTEEQSEERDIMDEVSICLFVVLCLSPKMRFFKLQLLSNWHF